MQPPSICIFTPTYNRAYTLGRLYQSLIQQTCMDFYWLIVDDGSTDKTESLVKSFLDENAISIKYIKTKNGGKQRAHNTAVMSCNSPFFTCVDSDDFLIETAVEDLLNVCKDEKTNEKIAGIVYLKGSSAQCPLGTRIPIDCKYTTLNALYSKYGFRGDAGLLYKTEILAQYQFDVHPDEKFIAESYIYNQIDQKYLLRTLNKILCICEYLPDGYSQNIRRITKSNPNGYLKLKKQAIEFDETLLSKFRDTILYIVGCRFAKRKGYIKEAPSRVLAIFAFIPAIIVKTLYFR